MGREEKDHETDSKARVIRFQQDLNANGSNEAELKNINTRVDTQLKIEDFMIRWREANHAKSKVWAPLLISGFVALVGVGAAYQGCVTHELEKKKATAEIVFKAVGGTTQETLANLNTLKEAHLLDLSQAEINTLSSLKPAPGK
jgi:hypothetical protein